jgi:hypothetical protein
VAQAERDQGRRAGTTTDERERNHSRLRHSSRNLPLKLSVMRSKAGEQARPFLGIQMTACGPVLEVPHAMECLALGGAELL